VLFELLARWAETDSPSVPLEHQAEYRVLWDILAMLESALAEPLMSDYQDWLIPNCVGTLSFVGHPAYMLGVILASPGPWQ